MQQDYKWLINVSNSLVLKVGRGSGFVNVDDLQVVLILLWPEISLIGGSPRLSVQPFETPVNISPE